ncbi:serine/threonine-protein kinase STY17-like [Prunus avium]|uniref:Serine/threonine-protein kinase STY17-like n=1 Tax=Prunus avium TaxID=42229 RepID=A0A6P5TAF2_PRUAV|nr:serine/threonine-protein kinase STY17-like [Prunus avium]
MQTEAPAMAGHEVLPVSQGEACNSCPTSSLENIEKGYCGSAPSFDPSWLIDPSCVEIGPKITEGPRSTVFQGLYKSKPVAVKIIEPTKESTESKEKFQREVILLAKVKHDNIVKFIGACFEPSLMILTELMRGGTVQKHLRNIRPQTLDLKLSISFALDISRAMEYLHANGIIHRDLKPANLLLTEDMKQIKLADFGHAREEIAGAMTSEAGTYRWMAPELFHTEPLPRGVKKQYDHKADVYSFSIVLWELLMNETPFRGRASIMAAYATAKAVRPSLDDIPEKIIPLLESCWAHDPKTRPEFMEITDFLSNLFKELCSTEAEPPKVVETEVEHPEKCNVKKEESAITNHVIDRPEEKKKGKRRKKSRSLSFLWCFVCKCWCG